MESAGEWNPMVPELIVTEINTSLKFYVDVIGFGIKFERVNPGFAYLDLEGAQLMLEELTEESWTVDEMHKPFGRGINFQIEVKDVHVLYEKLKSLNVSIFRDLKEEWYETGDLLSGQKEFLIQDPDGYLLRFSQYLGEK